MKTAHNSLNAAEIDRVSLCLGSAVFRREQSEKTNSAQWWGIFTHRYLEKLKKEGYQEAIQYVYAKFNRGKKMCEAIREEDLPEGEAEVGIVHVPAKRFARRVRFPDYGDAHTEIHAGKADVYNFDEISEMPIIYDYKCGPGIKDARTSQFLGLGAAFEDLHGTKNGAMCIAISVESNGKLTPYTHFAPPDELQEFREHAAQVHLKVIQARAAWEIDAEMPPFVAGDHCKWCHLFQLCPVTK